VPVKFAAIPSTAMGWAEWRGLLAAIARVKAEHPDLAGIVVTHGTATIEETVYLLSLTLPDDGMPVVVTGAQRPFTGLSSDGPMNLVAAARAAGDPASRGRGPLVVLNDEIHAAREVTKTSTSRMQTFRSPTSACSAMWMPMASPIGAGRALPAAAALRHLGHRGAAARGCRLFRRGRRWRRDPRLPRAGAAGIVAAGFAPGFTTPAEREALAEASAAGCITVMSSRAGSGRTFPARRYQAQGVINADNLNPQKARILLMLALTATRDRAEVAQLFATC
jgi:L-asparaginase